MNLVGEYIIGAPREAVWSAVNRVDLLRASIPGCQEIHEQEDGRLRAVVKLKIGVVTATLRGIVSLEDVQAPVSYTIVGEGEGGVAGFVRGTSHVRLDETDAATTKLSFDVDAKVGGKLASVGGRLLDATAKKLANQFFENFRAALIAEGVARPLEIQPSPGA
jgi:carbon monoxide dehydrogenase subunit G